MQDYLCCKRAGSSGWSTSCIVCGGYICGYCSYQVGEHMEIIRDRNGRPVESVPESECVCRDCVLQYVAARNAEQSKAVEAYLKQHASVVDDLSPDDEYDFVCCVCDKDLEETYKDNPNCYGCNHITICTGCAFHFEWNHELEKRAYLCPHCAKSATDQEHAYMLEQAEKFANAQ